MGNFYCLASTVLYRDGMLIGSQLAFSLSTGFVILTWRWNSSIEGFRIWPCRLSRPNMFSGIKEMKSSCYWEWWEECAICCVKRTFLTVIVFPHNHQWCWGGQKTCEVCHVVEDLWLRYPPEWLFLICFWRTSELWVQHEDSDYLQLPSHGGNSDCILPSGHGKHPLHIEIIPEQAGQQGW